MSDHPDALRLVGVPSFDNLVLDALRPAESRRLLLALEAVELKIGEILDRTGETVSHVYFPVDALISIFPDIDLGSRIEVACIGRDGMTAPGFLLGDVTAIGETVVQMSGKAWRVPVAALRSLVDGNPGLRSHLLSQAALALRHIVETSVFNGRATIVERLARWLTQAAHRVGSPRLVLTHDALAEIFGVHRPSVTVALQILEGKGLIHARRRTIEVRNAEGLAMEAKLPKLLPSSAGDAHQVAARR